MRAIASPLLYQSGYSPVIRQEQRPVGSSFPNSAGGVQPLWFNQLGYLTHKVMPVIAQRYGRQYLYLEQLCKDVFGHQKKTLTDLVIQNRQGKDIISNGNVISCITANTSNPVPNVVLEVTGFKSNGNPTNLAYWEAGRKIYNADGQGFLITATGTLANGNQTITIESLSNYNFLVTAGSCNLLPNGSSFSRGGLADRNGSACVCSYDHLQLTYDDWDSWLNMVSRNVKTFTRNRDTLQSKIYSIDFGMEIDGIYRDVVMYLNENEHIALAAAFMENNAELWFGQGNVNPNLAIKQGWGLIPQIPQEFRFNYTPGGTGANRLSYNKIRGWVKEWKLLNNNYTGNMLYCICGSDAYDEVQNILETESTAPIYWEKAMTNVEQTSAEYWLGKNFKGIHTFQGVNVAFIEYRAWNEIWAGPSRPSMFNPSRSFNSHLMYFVDPSPMAQLDVKTRNWENLPENKIDVYGFRNPQNLEQDLSQWVTYINGGLIDYNGNMQSQANTDENCAKMRIEFNQIANMNDLTASFMASPAPQIYAASA